MSTQERRPGPLPLLWALHRLRSVLSAHSLRDLDLRIAGREVPWFRDAQSHTERDDEWWMERDFSAGVPRVEAAVQMITGWYDAFTPWQLEDFAALQQAGRRRQLIIGPWTHTQEEMAAEGVREGVAWLGAHLRGEPHETAPVRIFVTGDAGGWRELERWPPDGYAARRLWLAGDGHLAWAAPETAGRRSYRYDPADPTPSAGGPVMITGKPVIDNRKLESRADVITFTSAPLDATVEAIGTPRVELFARASEPHFDLFARVCDVDRDGASWNVCDALASVTAGRFHRAEDDVWQVEFDLWPIAHRFAAGHRIRLQISSGAHPRYIRNPGTGEDPFTAETLRAVDVELVHGPEHPSCVLLPIACPS
jgi:putative CocE/NonD family hydrolase